LVYSIDKIKIEFQYLRLSFVNDFLRDLEFNYHYTDYYESNKITNCKHNFKFGDGEGAVYLGIIPNWKKEERYDKNIVLEYNPNKVNAFKIPMLERLLNIPFILWRIMSFDISVDLRLPYESIVMLKRDKREYIAKIGHSSVETVYLGRFGENGHIKLYNKAKEQKLDTDWTRFEITIKKINHLYATIDDFKEFCKLPTLYRKDVQLSISYNNINDVQRLALESIIDDIDRLYTIKRYDTRKKFEKMLFECLGSLDLNVESCFNAFDSYVEYIKSMQHFENVDLIEMSAIPVAGTKSVI